jgi:hypothetical protein
VATARCASFHSLCASTSFAARASASAARISSLPRRHLRRGQCGFELFHVGVFALELRPCVVDHRTAHEPAGEELLLAPDVRARELAHRAGLLQLLRGGLDLGRALADLQVRKARLGGAQSFLGFAAGGRLVLVLEREDRLQPLRPDHRA